jgi:uncharacterized protein YjgD (DUF1641 family)
MEEHIGEDMDSSTLELTQKLDLLAAQVAYLTEQAQIAARAREERQELFDTLMPIASDGMRLLENELEDVQAYLNPQDLIRLMKKAVRNLAIFDALLDQMSSVNDLIGIGAQISKEGVDKASEVFGELEQKGYFQFARSGARMVDNIVTSFSPADADRLGDNIVLILNTVKDMTQPEIMTFVRNTLSTAEREIEKPVDISYGALLSQMRDPAVRRGLALTLRVLRVVGEQGKSA